MTKSALIQAGGAFAGGAFLAGAYFGFVGAVVGSLVGFAVAIVANRDRGDSGR